MKRIILSSLAFLIMTSLCFADVKVKLTDIPENTNPASSDLLMIVHDPNGSPVSQKATITNVLKNVPSVDLSSYAHTSDLSGYVPTSRTVNGQALSSNVNIDLSPYALSSSLSSYALSSSLSGYVPTTRTVNGKALTTDITVSAGDIDLSLYAPKANPTFTGTVSGITASMVGVDLSTYAHLASPLFTGNVGIGSASPRAVLDVNGAIYGTYLYGNGSNLTNLPSSGGVSGLSTNKLSKASNSTTIVDSQIYDNGTNVGIGTNIPTSNLDVAGVDPIIYISGFNNPSTSNIQQNTTSSSGVCIEGSSSGVNYTCAQSFTLSSSMTITGVSTYFGTNGGSPSGAITVRIETNSSNTPSGTLANANATASLTPTASSWNDTNYTSFVLSAGTYWIVYNPPALSGSNFWRQDGSTSNPYSGGKNVYKSTGAWSDNGGGYDIGFKVYSSTVDHGSPKLSFKTNSNLVGSIYADGKNSDVIKVNTNGIDRFVFNQDGSIYSTGGNIGIGSSAPMQKLEVDGGVYPKNGNYYSSDGTVGVTVTTCTGFKNGLCISGS